MWNSLPAESKTASSLNVLGNYTGLISLFIVYIVQL